MTISDPQRQHPSSIIIGTLSFIKNSWRELLPIVIIPALSSSRVMTFVLSLAGGLLLLFTYRILYWMRFTYFVENDQITVRRGVFIRKETIMHKRRIHVVDFKAGIWQQLFGILTVQIKSAGVKGDSIELHAVEKKKAHELQKALLDEQQSASPEEQTQQEVAAPKKVYRMPFSDLSWHAATSKTFGFILFFASYLLSQLEPYLEREEVAHLIEESVSIIKSAVVLSVIVILGASYLLSFVYNLVRFYDFSITAHEDDLIISYGLLEKRRITVPVAKVQALRIERGIVHQLVGKCRIMMDLATENSPNDTQSGMLMPNIANDKLSAFLKHFFPDVELCPGYTPAPRRALTRVIIRTTPLLIVLSTVLFFFWESHWEVFLLLLLAIPWGYKRWKSMGLHLDAAFIYTRSQFIAVAEGIIWKRRIQTFITKQSLIQRYNRLADVQISVPSGRTEETYTVQNLEHSLSEWAVIWYRHGQGNKLR